MSTDKFSINNPIVLLGLSIPLLLMTGPFLPDLVLSICSIYFLIKKFEKIRTSKFFIFISAISLYFIMTSVFSKDIFYSFESSLFYFRIGLFALFIAYLINNFEKFIYYTYILLNFIIIFTFFDLLIQLYFKYDVFFIELNLRRPTAYFGDEEILGSFLSRLLPLYFAVHFLSCKKKYVQSNNIFLIPLIMSIAIILISEQRTAIFTLFLTLLMIFIFIDYYRLKVAYLFLSLLLMIFFFSFQYDSFKQKVFVDVKNGFSVVRSEKFKTGANYIITPSHTTLIGVSVDMFKDKPFMGHGPKMFRKICPNYISKYQKIYGEKIKCENHSHNFYFQLLSETGIFGFIILLSIFFYTTYSLLRNFFYITYKKKVSDKSSLTFINIILISFFVTLVPILPNGNFFNNWLMIIYSYPIGYYLYGINKKYK